MQELLTTWNPSQKIDDQTFHFEQHDIDKLADHLRLK